MADQKKPLPGKFDQALLLLRSLYGGLGPEEAEGLDEQTQDLEGQMGTRLALNIDPQADRMKAALAELASGGGRMAMGMGRGMWESAKGAGRGLGHLARGAFNPVVGPGGERMSALNVMMPGRFGTTSPPPEVQAILDAADEETR